MLLLEYLSDINIENLLMSVLTQTIYQLIACRMLSQMNTVELATLSIDVLKHSSITI